MPQPVVNGGGTLFAETVIQPLFVVVFSPHL